MCDVLNKKLIQAQDMADHSEQAQVVYRNAVGAYSIAPADRPGNEGVVAVITPTDRTVAKFLHDQLLNLIKAGVSKEDVVSAAYALGHRAGEKQTVTKVEHAVATIKAGTHGADVEEHF